MDAVRFTCQQQRPINLPAQLATPAPNLARDADWIGKAPDLRPLQLSYLSDSVRMSMTVFVRTGTDGNDAAIVDLADIEFKLDGGVMDMEAFTQHGANRCQKAGACRGGHIGDSHVAGERMSVAADAPHMQIVYGVNAGNAADGLLDAIQFQSTRRSFQQNVQAFADDADR